MCKITDYKHLSDSTLFSILRNIKPSQRKCLAGLDDTAAAAMNGFDKLQKVASNFSQKSLTDRLERGKRYLKTHYLLHCSDKQSDISSHSTAFALSDPKKRKLCAASDISADLCKDCNELCLALQKCEELVCEEKDPNLMYDVEMAIQSIVEYMKHKIRDAQQKKAKLYAYDIINQECAFWLKDFAQKIIPVRYREGQKEYFGKKGMSMHVDVFVLKKPDGSLTKHVYFTILYRCDQGTSAVISIADVVLKQFCQDEPLVCKLLAKSDNAGCYSGNYQAESMHELCKSKAIKLLRYDYNEPQCGKDQCDRESAAAKSILRSFVDAGNDLLSAEHVFTGLHYGKGMRNAAVSVIKVKTQDLRRDKVIGIQSYHSVEFQEENMVFWKFYDIGEGEPHPYTNLDAMPVSEVILPFSNTDKQQIEFASCSKAKKAKQHNHQLCSLFYCMESGCTSSFERRENLETHVLFGKHTTVQAVTRMDAVKGMFVTKVKALSKVRSTASAVVHRELSSASKYMKILQTEGWALPVRSNFRFSFEQKTILYDCFINGELTGYSLNVS